MQLHSVFLGIEAISVIVQIKFPPEVYTKMPEIQQRTVPKKPITTQCMSSPFCPVLPRLLSTV